MEETEMAGGMARNERGSVGTTTDVRLRMQGDRAAPKSAKGDSGKGKKRNQHRRIVPDAEGKERHQHRRKAPDAEGKERHQHRRKASEAKRTELHQC